MNTRKTKFRIVTVAELIARRDARRDALAAEHDARLEQEAQLLHGNLWATDIQRMERELEELDRQVAEGVDLLEPIEEPSVKAPSVPHAPPTLAPLLMRRGELSERIDRRVAEEASSPYGNMWAADIGALEEELEVVKAKIGEFRVA